MEKAFILLLNFNQQSEGSGKATTEILAEENPCVFISDPNNCVLKKKNVKGFTYYPISFYDLSSLYFE